MTFNRNQLDEDAFQFGTSGAVISLVGGDYTPPVNCKGIVVVAAGDVVCRPLHASADITITAAPVGWLLPWHCSKIEQTGTTATLATILD